MSELGYEEGDQCGREGCGGVVEMEEVENCSCHINPPCWQHENADTWCPECGWRAKEDPLCVRQIHTIRMDMSGPAVSFEAKRRVLDPTKIDWIWKPHSGSSMIKEGVFPIGTERSEVEKAVLGTFGGRFTFFSPDQGRFQYIAYTD